MKRKVLSAALAATLMLSSVAPSFAEELDKDVAPVGIQSSAKPDIRRGSSFSSLKPKTGKQKVLCIMVEFDNQKFGNMNDEEYYYNQLFGKDKTSLKSYLRDQSDGRMKIYPADVKNAKYPGVIKVKMNASKYGTVSPRDYSAHDRIVKDVFNQIKNQVEWDKIDENGDKVFEESFLYENDALEEELLFTFVFSGDTQVKKPGTVTAWTHLSPFNGYADGYKFKNTAIITSERTGTVVGSSDFAHEYLHNLNARDMYLDWKSVGPWSVMCSYLGQNHKDFKYTPTPVDPYHKLYFKWAKPVEVKLDSAKPVEIKYNKREVPYIVDPRDSNIIYLLDYMDYNNYYTKGLNRYGVKSSGMVVWKINRREAERDWMSSSDGYYDWYINSAGPKTAVSVMNRSDDKMKVKDSFVEDGKERSIDGTLIKVKPSKGKMYVYYRGV